MIDEQLRQKTVIIGAGPVGSLAALYAAQRGHEVEVYELRNDMRIPSATHQTDGKTINFALSERGINSLKLSRKPRMVAKILEEVIPLRARMIHGRRKSGALFEESQDYDAEGRTIFAIDRNTIHSQLFDELCTMPNVKLFFNHKLVGLDLKSRKVTLEAIPDPVSKKGEIIHKAEVSFDLLIGADGAHSATRRLMMRDMCMDFTQSYIDTLWCEFIIEASSPLSQEQSFKSKFRLSPDHLHIWPGKEYMFIGIPSLSGDFICTLFAPSSVYKRLSKSPEELLEFFDQNFPGVTPDLIPAEALVESFTKNTHHPLISVQCSPHHYQDCAVILGDATHAMVPFYGQGINAGFEDVRVLFETLDTYTSSSGYSLDTQALALQRYSELRVVDSQAVSKLAMDNYIEMRSSVTSRLYKCRKLLEEKLYLWFPRIGWKTKYSMVSFENIRYSEVIKRSDRQDAIITQTVTGLGILGLSGVLCGIWKLRRIFANSPFGW